MCSDKLLDPIDNRNECKQKFEAIKEVYPDLTDNVLRVNSWRNIPKGCFFDILDKDLDFNTHYEGSPSTFNRQVCKTKEYKGNTNNKYLFIEYYYFLKMM